MKRTSWPAGLPVSAGGEEIADIDVLRHQTGVLGPVASPPTVWRVLKAITPGRRKKIAAARARVRRHVWGLLPGGVAANRLAGTDLGEVIALDIDATIVVTHSEKENANGIRIFRVDAHWMMGYALTDDEQADFDATLPDQAAGSPLR